MIAVHPGMTIWPSGLRRQLQVLVRKGVGSNPTVVTHQSVILSTFCISGTILRLIVTQSLPESGFCFCSNLVKIFGLTGPSVRTAVA